LIIIFIYNFCNVYKIIIIKLLLTDLFGAKENLQQQLLRFVAPNARCCAVVALLHSGLAAKSP
jgi:hypothetical protein